MIKINSENGLASKVFRKFNVHNMQYPANDKLVMLLPNQTPSKPNSAPVECSYVKTRDVRDHDHVMSMSLIVGSVVVKFILQRPDQIDVFDRALLIQHMQTI
jgi:hypothetical protein